MIIILYFFILILTTEVNAKIYYPDHISVQYAGNMGFLSVGVGHSFLNHKLKTELFYGYLPKLIGGSNIHTISLKFNYKPWFIVINKNNKINPLSFGALVIYTLGDKYFLKQSRRYPDDYYKANAVHFNPFLEVSLINKSKFYKNYFNSLELYMDIAVLDEYLGDYIYSKFNEGYVKMKDVINLSFGFRLYF